MKESEHKNKVEIKSFLLRMRYNEEKIKDFDEKITKIEKAERLANKEKMKARENKELVRS